MHEIVRPGAMALIGVLCLGNSATALATFGGGGCNNEFFARQLQAYEPIYFVVGNDDDVGYNAKFQISVDFRFFCTSRSTEQGVLQGTGRSVVERLSELHLGFSQTSIWDLSEVSSPFRDSSYRPRLFYRLVAEDPSADRWFAELDAGFAHESNGRAGASSRSLNLLFVRPKWSFGLGSGGSKRLNVQPMIYTYSSVSGNNRDIADYRGYADLRLEYLWDVPAPTAANRPDPWMVWTDLRKGNRSNFGSVEVSLAVPFRTVLHDVHGWLMLQYFNGYGENLLEYNVKDDAQYRLGFAIVI
ncbi:MAG TPA: phospholipase A [Steroidobacteraceae bacterium]|jgi:outer membrane phospholipase A